MSKVPKIRVINAGAVTIDPIKSVAGLSSVMTSFSKLINAKRGPSMGRLSTAVGDLSASVFSKEGDDFTGTGAEEVAEVLIATLVIATCIGLSCDEIATAFVQGLECDATDRVSALINNSLENSGLKAA